MPTFNVCFSRDQSITVRVKAENRDEAVEVARQEVMAHGFEALRPEYDFYRDDGVFPVEGS